MTNIWGFCLQTITVSLVAALLLLVKGLLADKLSPRWQYGVWAVLALRILLPASTARNLVAQLGVWLETGKAMAEQTLHSAYSAVYAPIELHHVFPYINEKAVSVTDWLFVIYAAGVAVSLLWHLISYIRLRLRLRHGDDVSPAIRERIANVRLKHWIKPWRAVQVEGISSAFVCGVFRPVLVIPAGQDIDEKVLLHELLHLQYRDALQSIFWTVLRCLHWCNPFLHYVFDRIGNDMESLCDQRVLERLEGEERRQYGMILLTMANERYARAPGTTSISNGGRNIARRIEAIVRFKQYPKGMSLVSVCIALVLLSPVLVGSAASFDNADYQPRTPDDLSRAMAVARVQRCSTVAGAIDTYAKGLMQENGIYVAIASPLAAHEEIQKQMIASFEHEGWVAWHLDNGRGLEDLNYSKEYALYDVVETDDGSYHAWLTLAVGDFVDEAYQNWPTDVNGVPIVSGTVIIPLRIFREGDTWVVEERDERILANMRFDQIEYYGDDIPWLLEKTVECETGTVTITHRTVYHVENAVTTNSIFGWTTYDDSLKPDAEFFRGWLKYHYVYQMDPDSPVQPVDTATLEIKELDSLEALPEFEDFTDNYGYSDEYEYITGSSNQGGSFHKEGVDEDWDGVMESGGGHGLYETLEGGELFPLLPAGYAFRISFDGEVVEEFVIGGFADE